MFFYLQFIDHSADSSERAAAGGATW